MQLGVSTWEAAGFLGMSEKTLRDVYGHHHPDYLHGAANAISARKPISLVNSLVSSRRRRSTLTQPLEKAGGPGRSVAIKQFQSLAVANLANGSAWPAKAFPGAGKPPRQIAAVLERGAGFW